MPNSLKKCYLLITVILSSCSSHNSPLFKKDISNENERHNNLFVFVGEKIAVEDIPYQSGDFDQGVKARYKVLEIVYGEYSGDTIEFNAYDHYGSPPFAKYKNVLMFLSQQDGKYYMEKYQFVDVYKTQNGRWAGAYQRSDYGHKYNEGTGIVPEKIPFLNEVSYTLQDTNDLKFFYQPPYFKIEGNKAIAIYGNYIEELFKLKRDGVLTARKLFGNRNTEDEIPEIVNVSDSGYVKYEKDKKFMPFWKQFCKIVKQQDKAEFRKMMFDSIWSPCNDIIPSGSFIKTCFNKMFSKALLKKMKDTSAAEFSWYLKADAGLFPFVFHNIVKDGDEYKLIDVHIANLNHEPWTFTFIRTKGGYKLYNCNYYVEGYCCG